MSRSLTQLHQRRPLFQIRSHSQGPRCGRIFEDVFNPLHHQIAASVSRARTGSHAIPICKGGGGMHIFSRLEHFYHEFLSE